MAWAGRMIGPKSGEVHRHGTEAAERIADFGVLEEKDCRLDTVQVQAVVGCSCCWAFQQNGRGREDSKRVNKPNQTSLLPHTTKSDNLTYYNAMETLISVAPTNVQHDHVADPNTAVGESGEAEVRWSPTTRRR